MASEEEEDEKEKKLLEMKDKFHQEPFFTEFPRFLESSRRNLIVFSLISILSTHYGFDVINKGELKVWGDITLNPDGPVNIQIILFWILLYHMIHFVWSSIVYLKENRLRLTGTLVSVKTDGRAYWGGGVNDVCDYPSTSRQATLFWWWSTYRDSVRRWYESIEGHFQNLNSPPDVVKNVNTELYREISGKYGDIKNVLDNGKSAFSFPRVPVSLERFDNYFKVFGWEQILGRVFLDIVLPTFFSFIAFIIIWPWPDMFNGHGRLLGGAICVFMLLYAVWSVHFSRKN